MTLYLAIYGEGAIEHVTLSLLPPRRCDLVYSASPQLQEVVDAYLRGGPLPPFSWPRLPPFTRVVLDALLDIPPGERISYGALAAILGRPKAARAIGNACRRNPFPYFYPCHRVVAAHSLGGFACGMKIKEKLLSLETQVVRFDALSAVKNHHPLHDVGQLTDISGPSVSSEELFSR